jgi:phosphoglycolate phosphatase
VVIGFDLDMTLVDSRPGIAATYRELSRLTGVPIDADAAVGRLGPPLEHEIARWYPPEQRAAAVDRYRGLYPDHAIAPSGALPGAAGAIAAVHARGGRVLVVTAKKTELARLHLEHLGLDVDEVHGLVWAGGKARVLRAAGAYAYAGDHVMDIAAAREAGCVAIGVPTGPCSAAELSAAGADVVLEDLRAFPAWLAQIELGPRVSDD